MTDKYKIAQEVLKEWRDRNPERNSVLDDWLKEKLTPDKDAELYGLWYKFCQWWECATVSHLSDKRAFQKAIELNLLATASHNQSEQNKGKLEVLDEFSKWINNEYNCEKLIDGTGQIRRYLSNLKSKYQEGQK